MLRSIAPVLVLVVACKGDEPIIPIDASSTSDVIAETTSCANPIPTTAPATVTLSGVVADGNFDGSGNTLTGATVAAFGSGTITMTENGGIYQLPADTGGVPIQYLQLSNTGYQDTRFYPHAPIAKSLSLPRLPIFSIADAAMFATTFGVTQDADKGVVIIQVSTCQDSQIADATVSVSPAGTSIVKYLHSDGSTTGTATDGTGLAIVFDVTTDAVTIDAASSPILFHPHSITADPSFLTIAAIAEQ